MILTDKDAVNQIKKVFRMRTGDRVLFLDGAGKEYETEISSMDDSVLNGKVIGVSENKNETDLKIVLCQALCKKDKFEWVLQKGVEIGVVEFIPVLADRSEKFGFNGERAEKILKEAAEQSERGIVPKLQEVRKFEDALGNIIGKKIILDKSGESIRTFKLPTSDTRLNIFIGPEGGWTEAELATAKKSGAEIISLGSRVLRTETAGMAASAILLNR